MMHMVAVPMKNSTSMKKLLKAEWPMEVHRMKLARSYIIIVQESKVLFSN